MYRIDSSFANTRQVWPSPRFNTFPSYNRRRQSQHALGSVGDCLNPAYAAFSSEMETRYKESPSDDSSVIRKLKEEIEFYKEENERLKKEKKPKIDETLLADLKCGLSGRWLVQPVRLLADGCMYDETALSVYLQDLKKRGGQLKHSPSNSNIEISQRKKKLQSETQFCPECRLIKNITLALISNGVISQSSK